MCASYIFYAVYIIYILWILSAAFVGLPSSAHFDTMLCFRRSRHTEATFTLTPLRASLISSPPKAHIWTLFSGWVTSTRYSIIVTWYSHSQSSLSSALCGPHFVGFAAMYTILL